MATSQTLSFLLSEMVPVLDGLIGLSEEKKDVLVTGDVPRLTELVSSELELVAKLDRLESERVRLHPFEGPSDDAGDVRGTVRERLLRLKRLNEVNMALAKSSLQVVQHGFRVLLPQQSGYEGTPLAMPLVFDRKS